ncbi:MAG: hypothetical protein ACK56K_03310, partial [Akkermansiaceae bacterium]
ILDPLDLAEEVERRLGEIFRLVERIEEDRWEEMERAGESRGEFSAGADFVAASVAPAPYATPTSTPTEKLVKTSSNNQKTTNRRVS